MASLYLLIAQCSNFGTIHLFQTLFLFSLCSFFRFYRLNAQLIAHLSAFSCLESTIRRISFIFFIFLIKSRKQLVSLDFLKKTPRESTPRRVYFLQIIAPTFYNLLKFFKLLPCILFRAFAPHPDKSRPSPPWADGVRAPHRHRSDNPAPL